MNKEEVSPLEEIEKRIVKYSKDLEDKRREGTICYQHKLLAVLVLKMVILQTLERKERFKKFAVLYADFFESLGHAQTMGEVMEKGLEKRKELMIKAGLEEGYQLSK